MYECMRVFMCALVFICIRVCVFENNDILIIFGIIKKIIIL